MLYLLIAILCGSVSVVLFKVFSKEGVSVMPAVTVNYLIAFLLGCVLNAGGGFVVNPFVQSWMPWAVVMGILFIGAFVLMSHSTVYAGVAVTSVSARMSLIVPVVLSSLFFGVSETPSWLAITVIFIALMLILYRNKGKLRRQSGRVKEWLLPLSVFLSFGFCHFLLKYVQSDIESEYTEQGYVQSQFAALTSALFLSAMVIGALICASSKNKSDRRFGKGEISGGVLLGAANFFSTYLVLYALQSLPAVVFFPVYNVGVVLVTSLVGVVCFKERFTVVQIAGMCVALVGIVLFFVR